MFINYDIYINHKLKFVRLFFKLKHRLLNWNHVITNIFGTPKKCYNALFRSPFLIFYSPNTNKIRKRLESKYGLYIFLYFIVFLIQFDTILDCPSKPLELRISKGVLNVRKRKEKERNEIGSTWSNLLLVSSDAATKLAFNLLEYLYWSGPSQLVA